jgi:large subunit ribosomal protein L32
MAHPKRRQSHQRTAKRRTHYTANMPTLSTDKTTGETHQRHRAHWVEHQLFYKGRVVMEKAVAEETSEEDNGEA